MERSNSRVTIERRKKGPKSKRQKSYGTAGKPKRVRYYGLTKVKQGEKVCFVSKENKHGWSLGFAFNNRIITLTNLRFKSKEEVKRALASKVVFVELAAKK